MKRLEERIGVTFADEKTALAALTHKSYVNEHRSEGLDDNERLEFLGDAVVDLVVSHRLMEKLPRAREGELSKLRAAVVNEDGLAAVATQVGLGELLRLGRGEEMSGGREKPSLLADAFEAVIGAIYLGGGLDAVFEAVDRHFGDAIDRAVQGVVGRDYKTLLQEQAQGRYGVTPRYRVVDETGPDHSKTFTVEIEVDGRAIGTGSGRSKKDAEQAAAREGLATLATRAERASAAEAEETVAEEPAKTAAPKGRTKKSGARK